MSCQSYHLENASQDELSSLPATPVMKENTDFPKLLSGHYIYDVVCPPLK